MHLLRRALTIVAILVVANWFYQNQQTKSWPSTEATIIDKGSVTARSRERTYHFSVGYSYKVEDAEYEGRHSFSGGGSQADGEAVRDELAQVKAYYDPMDPARSTLQRGKAPFPFLIFLTVVAAVLALAAYGKWQDYRMRTSSDL